MHYVSSHTTSTWTSSPFSCSLLHSLAALSVVFSSLSLQPYHLTNEGQNLMDLDNFAQLSFFFFPSLFSRGTHHAKESQGQG